jgi:hypothetical protein
MTASIQAVEKLLNQYPAFWGLDKYQAASWITSFSLGRAALIEDLTAALHAHLGSPTPEEIDEEPAGPIECAHPGCDQVATCPAWLDGKAYCDEHHYARLG